MTKTIEQMAKEVGLSRFSGKSPWYGITDQLEAMCKAYHAQECEGWQLVPIDPTEEMVNSMTVAVKNFEIDDTINNAKEMNIVCYKAMLASAPKKGE